MARSDHIRVKRWGGLYHHHGIDIGDGTIVHFSGEPLQSIKAEVRRDPLETFLEGGEPEIIEYAAETRDADTVVEAALAEVGHTGYNMWRNNCEHFACRCKTGYHESGQVRRALKSAATMAAGVAVVAGVLTVRALTRRLGAGDV